MNKIKGAILSLLVRRYALGALVKLWAALEGNRTQISWGLAVLALLAGFFRFIPMDDAFAYASLLGGAGVSTFLEKLKRHQKFASQFWY